ncbi:hypothetical protein Tco_0446971, partial [Tanacetum coccineum]
EKVAANLYQLKGEIMEEAEASVASHSNMASEAWTYVGTRNEDSCGKEATSWPQKGFFTFM